MSSKDKKYKYTRQLLKLAVEHTGYTHEEIAVKSRLSRKSISLVSKWRTGKALATEVQMAYFIKEYGHLLKRKMEHLFWGYEKKNVFLIFSGEEIFKHQIRIFSKKGKSEGTISVLRLVILRDEDVFHVISQIRGGLTQTQLRERRFPNVYHSDNEDGNWLSYKCRKSIDLHEMHKEFKSFMRSLLDGTNPVDKLAGNSVSGESRFFGDKHTHPLTHSLFEKLMKLGLLNSLYPS